MTDTTNTASGPSPSRQNGHDLSILGNDACWTPEIDGLSKVVAHLVRCDVPGATVYGAWRSGKTECCKYLRRVIPEILGGTAVAFIWNIEIGKIKGELECFRDWLAQSGSTAINHNRVGILKARLYDHLIAAADAVGATRIILILDEAHRFSTEHLQIVSIIFNALQLRGKCCFVLLVGEPSLAGKRKELETANQMQIVGRFFCAEHEFHGIHLDRLHELLEFLDEDGRITMKHLPERATRGFRLEQLAPFYKGALSALQTELTLSGEVRLPMQFLRGSLNDIVYALVEGGREIKVDQTLVRAGLASAGFERFMHRYMVRAAQ